MAGTPDPVRAWSTVVPPAWIDYNGHLNEGYYGVAFGDASDGILTHLGFDAGYRAAHGTIYTAQTRIRPDSAGLYLSQLSRPLQPGGSRTPTPAALTNYVNIATPRGAPAQGGRA